MLTLPCQASYRAQEKPKLVHLMGSKHAGVTREQGFLIEDMSQYI